jgi:hypothetical protein
MNLDEEKDFLNEKAEDLQNKVEMAKLVIIEYEKMSFEYYSDQKNEILSNRWW